MIHRDTTTPSRDLEDALLAMDRAAVLLVIAAAARANDATHAGLADEIIVPALARIGDQWEAGTVALSQVYMSARILEEVLEAWFQPVRDRRAGPRIGIGVLEDYHALGKRIVHAILNSAGRDVVDLGTALSVDAMVEAAIAADIQVLMISVLMFNKALHVSQVVEKLKASGHGHIRVVVGGAPFVMDPELWRRVGADACGRNASEALRLSAARYEGVTL